MSRGDVAMSSRRSVDGATTSRAGTSETGTTQENSVGSPSYETSTTVVTVSSSLTVKRIRSFFWSTASSVAWLQKKPPHARAWAGARSRTPVRAAAILCTGDLQSMTRAYESLPFCL